MLRKSFWILICSLLASAGSAQNAPEKAFVHLLKWNPTCVIDFTPSFQFAYEFRGWERFSMQLEAGYINNLLVEWPTEEFHNMQGIRLRFEPRYYWTDNSGPKVDQFYVTPEFVWINYAFDRTREFGYNCVEDGFWGPVQCDYFRLVTYQGRRNVFAGHAKIGVMSPFGLNTRRVYLDAYIGLGFRHVSQTVSGVPNPEDAQTTRQDFPWGENEINEFRFSASAGFKIGLRVK